MTAVRLAESGRFHLHLHALMTHQLDARASVEPTAPVTPEERRRTDDEVDAAGRSPGAAWGSAALPLTLFAQGTGTATADAGRIDHAQAPIGFSAPLMDNAATAQPDSATCHLAGGAKS